MNCLRACARLAVNCQKVSIIINQQPKREIKRYMAPLLKQLTKRKRAQKDKIVDQRSKYLEWNRNAEIFAFNNRLSEKFDKELLDQAFTCRSYVIQEEEEQKKLGIENPQLDILDNRELIKEGKQILPLIVENYLNQALPLAPQECIFTMKNYLLSQEILASTSSGIGTKDLILARDFPPTQELLEDTFYALISALNRSVDLEHTSIFVRDILIAKLGDKELAEVWCPENPVEILNDILARENREVAEPRIIAQTGINTLFPVYNIGLYSNKELLSTGFGQTIEEAEKIAALNCLMEMFRLSDSSSPFRCNIKIDNSGLKNASLQEWSRSNI